MRSRISNLIVVGLLALLSGCYLSHEKGRSTEDDDPSPSVNGSSPSVVDDIPTAVGGDYTATGGNPSIDVGGPSVDAGIEEASLLGVWRGRVAFVVRLDDVGGSEQIATVDGFGLEFTETEMVLSYGGIDLYGFSYSINGNVNPYQMDIKLESVRSNLVVSSERIDYESTNFFPASATYRLENGELSLSLPILSPSEGPPMVTPPFDPKVIKLTMIFELTRV